MIERFLVRNFFPEKEEILVSEFAEFANFFPITILEGEYAGETFRIPVIYTFFEGSQAESRYFATDEYAGDFSFHVKGEKFRPSFDNRALVITDEYRQFLDESLMTFARMKSSRGWPLSFPPAPRWLQADDTPMSAKGRPLQFICQLELAGLVDDDCMMYVFLNPETGSVRTVYQRD
ncbi:MAG: hypothetical protein J7527_00510 [Chitinophagaceae bacterium]|nr:hypothetical protein [Chitinophagaceae bacterium]